MDAIVCWHRCIEGPAGRGGSSDGREFCRQPHGRGDRRSDRPAESAHRRSWWRSRLPAASKTVVAAGLAGAGLPVVVVNPAQVRAFAQALGKRAKTDPIDAAVIAHFAEATKPRASATAGRDDTVARRSCRPPAPDRRDDRGRKPTRRVTSLFRLKKSIARLRKALEKELSELDDVLISDHVRGSPVWVEKEDLARLSAWYRPSHRAHPDRRTAGTRFARPPPDRGARRTLRPGPGNPGNGAAKASSAAVASQRCVASSSWAPWSRRVTIRTSSCFRDKLVAAGKTEARRDRRRRPQAAHHPQRNPARQNAHGRQTSLDRKDSRSARGGMFPRWSVSEPEFSSSRRRLRRVIEG